jgi:hypothetical protein
MLGNAVLDIPRFCIRAEFFLTEITHPEQIEKY